MSTSAIVAMSLIGWAISVVFICGFFKSCRRNEKLLQEQMYNNKK